MRNESKINKILKEGYEYLKKGDYEKALENYLKGFDDDQNNIALINNIAQVYTIIGDFKHSQKYHEKLINLCQDNQDEETLMIKGNSLMILNNLTEAYETYEKLITLNPTYLPYLFQIAAILYKKEDYKKSNQYLDKILKKDKNNIIALLNKGMNYQKMGNYKKAQRYYDKVLKLSPKHEEAITLKGELLKEKGNNEELKKHIAKTLKIKPNSAYTLMLKAMEYANEKNDKKAFEFFDRAISIDPFFDEAYFNKGGLLMLKKRYDEAIECYKKAFEINPESGGIHDKESLFELLNHMKNTI